jgi:hypothetical protein
MLSAVDLFQIHQFHGGARCLRELDVLDLDPWGSDYRTIRGDPELPP